MNEEMVILNLVLGVLDHRVDEMQRFVGRNFLPFTFCGVFEAITI